MYLTNVEAKKQYIEMETKLSELSLCFSNTIVGKPVKCGAAVVRVVREVIVHPSKAHEVRIRIICTCLYFSDVTFWKLNVPPACFPRILGHKVVGSEILIDWWSIRIRRTQKKVAYCLHVTEVLTKFCVGTCYICFVSSIALGSC